MVMEYTVTLEGTTYPVIISDEPEALLAAKAAGRAIIGVDTCGNNWNLRCASYVVPAFGDITEELAVLVLRRHLGLPWMIAVTGRLVIREFVREDACCIPEEEYGREEHIFRSPEQMAGYIEKQYGFYEYGTWALTEKDSGILVGMAGVSNPRLPDYMERLLGAARGCGPGEAACDGGPGGAECDGGPGEAECHEIPEQAAGGSTSPWLELGYHIFRPYRRMGYGAEAVSAVMDYAHEVLNVRLCALIDAKNQASRALAECLGMRCAAMGDLAGPCLTGTDTQSSKELLLYVESRQSPPDREVL